MFEHAFSWLYSQLSEFTLPNQAMTHKDCVIQINLVTEQVSITRRHYLGLKYKPSHDSKDVQRALDEFQRTEQYLLFLKACEPYLQETPSIFLYELMLNIALANPKIIPTKASAVLSGWLAQDSHAAIQYYETYCEAALRATDVSSSRAIAAILMGKMVTEHYLLKLKTILRFEKNPLAFCRLLTHQMCFPLQFVAGLVWMIQQGVDAGQLLRTGILNQFLQYHYDALAEVSGTTEAMFNNVSLIYGVMEHYHEMKPLIDLAKGSHCSVPGYEMYNLLGIKQSVKLAKVAIEPDFPLLTRESRNAHEIITAFGQEGLIEIVRTLFDGSKHRFNHWIDPFDGWLVSYLQKSDWIKPSLIQKIAHEKLTELTKWVCFVDDKCFEEWINQNELSVIYLLPEKQDWISRISLSMMESFLQLIFENDKFGSEMDTINLLMCLYNVSTKKNLEMSESIYNSIVDYVLRHRYLIEDPHVFSLLRHSPFKEKLVKFKISQLRESLTQKVQDMLSQPLSYSNYVDLCSEWECLNNEIEILEMLKPVQCAFPTTKLDFIVYLFHQYALRPDPCWDVFIESMEFELLFSGELSGQKSQVLYKILSSLDNEVLRLKILDTLQLDSTLIRDEHDELLLAAISAGNVGLMDWYLQEMELDDALLKQAIISKQWGMIEHWFLNYELPEFSVEVTDHLLVAAAASKNTRLLRRIIHDYGFSFSAGAVSNAFAKAASCDDGKALYLLYELKPVPMGFRAAFALAVDNNCQHAIRFFKGLKKPKEQLKYEVERTFQSAVSKNNLDLVKCLLEFSVNAPNRKMIQREMEKARSKRHKEIADFLDAFLHPLPSAAECRAMKIERGLRIRSAKSFCSTESLPDISFFTSPIRVAPESEPLPGLADRGTVLKF